jgi:HAD superfamily hydrolase (TIGR01549 family)
MKDTFHNLLSQVDVLSLDVFDTTLGRRCALPEDAFTLIEEALVNKYGPLMQGFARQRMEADPAARRRAWDTRQAEEVSMEDIYSVIKEARPEWPVPVEEFITLELETEKRLLYPLEDARKMIEAARSLGKKVIFISDMYLPQAFCEDRLREHGFDDYDAFFLSATIGVLKHTGKLFEHALRELKVSPDRILHVGDNEHSDGKQARKKGLRTHIVNKAINQLEQFPQNPWTPVREQGSRTGRESLLLGLSACGCQKEPHHSAPLWYRIGYQIGGPLMYGYIRFLIEKVRGRGIKKVYFLSRDGFILKQVYEQFSRNVPDCPEADYLYASRRALNFASITELDQKTEDWLAQGIHLTVGDFLRRINLDPANHHETIIGERFTGPDHLVVEGQDYTNLRSLYRCILPAILEAAEREREIYLDYLRGKGVLDADPFVMVDVGWMTSIQHSFAKMLHPVAPKLEIEGYYLGTYPEALQRASSLSTHVHYLMEYGQPAQALDTIRHCVCLLEFFFAAPERTFLNMRRDSEGGFTPELASFHENESDLAKLEHIHQGVLEYTQSMLAVTGNAPIEIRPQEVLNLLHRFLAEPTEEEARQLGEIHYADGYGSYFHHTQMARPSGWKRLGLSKRKWKKEFKLSHWPKGYYMRLSPAEQLLFKIMHPSHRFSKPYE